LVACDCTKCNGKLVDYRTKVLHEINQNPEDSLNQNLEDNLEETEIEGHQPDETSPEIQAESEFYRDNHQYESEQLSITKMTKLNLTSYLDND